LFIELGKIRWSRGNQFGVEFIRFPTLTRHRLDRVIEEQLTGLLERRVDATSHESRRVPSNSLASNEQA
jgi:hypothetical protein